MLQFLSFQLFSGCVRYGVAVRVGVRKGGGCWRCHSIGHHNRHVARVLTTGLVTDTHFLTLTFSQQTVTFCISVEPQYVVYV